MSNLLIGVGLGFVAGVVVCGAVAFVFAVLRLFIDMIFGDSDGD